MANGKNASEFLSLRQSLLQMLEAATPHEEKLLEDLERRKAKGDPLYSSILQILAHLTFSEAEASRHWKRIVVHREGLRTQLGRDPGLRVAVLDYFLNVSRELKSPKVIEMSIFERTERSAITDGLTSLYNHSYFLSSLRQEILRSKRHDSRTALLLLDLDDFKQLNDGHGHVEGDRVLARTAALLRETVREIDMAARYGGEEFAVILPDTSPTGAYVVAERVRERIEERFRRGRPLPAVTISGGIAVYPDDAATPADLIVRADEALYRAKAAGKNRITLARGERRRHLRVPASTPVSLGASGRRVAAARAKNWSEGGLLVSLRDPVPVGSAVDLVIRSPDTAARGVRAEVVRVERATGEKAAGYDVGIRFLEAPPPVEIAHRRRKAR
jgi:diguanylate cyclase (GGDEF)-like protein